tara:strand:+ start:277 stop:453 length:177 start_codon:yes stop_codon:yes gene_type:complete
MSDKIGKNCSNCDTKYTIVWNEEEQDLKPLTCPFCGYEVTDEENAEQHTIEEEHDNWD